MDNNYIEITIGNNTYYIETSRVSDLAFIDNKLVNVSNNSITMVSSFDSTTTYPRITCSSMSACILRTNSSSSYQLVYNNYELPDKFNMNLLSNSQQNSILIGLLTIVLALKLMWKK